MARDPEQRSQVAPLALAHAAARGVAMAPLLERYGVPAGVDLSRPAHLEVALTTGQLNALLDEVALATSEPHLGLVLAKGAPRGLHGLGEFLLRSTGTVARAIEGLVRFNALFNPGLRITSATTAELITVGFGVPGYPGAQSRHRSEFSAAVIVLGLRTLVDQLPLAGVWFEHPAPPDTLPHAEFFGAPVEFGASDSGFSFARALAELPVKSSDPALHEYLEAHALAALAARPKADDLVDQLRHAIREALGQGEPAIEPVAARVHLTARTLQRRLAEANTSFQEVLDGVRYDLARAYLDDQELDLSQVAYLLGYSELRAFDRAFRRWSGAAPREWRQRPR